MKAVILKERRISVKEVPLPSVEEGEALIRVIKAGICNTDLEMIKGKLRSKTGSEKRSWER